MKDFAFSFVFLNVFIVLEVPFRVIIRLRGDKIDILAGVNGGWRVMKIHGLNAKILYALNLK